MFYEIFESIKEWDGPLLMICFAVVLRITKRGPRRGFVAILDFTLYPGDIIISRL